MKGNIRASIGDANAKLYDMLSTGLTRVAENASS